MENQNLPQELKASQQLALSDSPENKDRLDELLAGCFALQKMYGRAPESMETIVVLFHSILGKYPGEKVTRAFEIWLEQSQEFPTPADIIGIIRRNGRQPVPKEIYISISKKDYDSRTYEEKKLMERYEEEQKSEQWELETDEQKKQITLEDNIQLRRQIKELCEENKRLARILHKERVDALKEAPKPEIKDRIQRTVDFMLTSGAPKKDIADFLLTVPQTEQAA